MGCSKIFSVSFVVVLSLAFSGEIVQAQVVPSTADSQYIQGDFSKKLDNQKKLDNSAAEALPEAIGKYPKKGEEKLLKLNSVLVEGSTVYSQESFKSLYGNLLGNKVSVNDLRRVADKITKKYRDDGYILSRAVIKPQKGKDVVKIAIIEGYFSEVKLAGDVQGDVDVIREYAEKLSNKKPVNKRDIERYVLLIDDLPGVTARSVIRPGRVKDSSQLVIFVEHNNKEFSLTADNFGSRYVGPVQYSGVAAFNSYMGMYERTSIRTILAPHDEELYFADVLHEQQVGSEGGKIKARYAFTNSYPGANLENLDIEGKTRLGDLSFEFPYLRTRTENLTLKSGIRAIDSESEILSTQLSEDKVRTVYLGYMAEFRDSTGASNVVEGKVTQGIDGLGSTDDGTGRSRVNGKHDFSKFSIDVNRLQHVYEGIYVMLGFNGQYSTDPLLSAEEVAYGGRRYGRAYNAAEITGDRGVAGSMELRYGDNIFDSIFDSVQYYAFYDASRVWNKDLVVGENARESIASTGVGIRVNFQKQFYGDISLALPLTKDVSAEGNEGDDPRAFFSLTKRF